MAGHGSNDPEDLARKTEGLRQFLTNTGIEPGPGQPCAYLSSKQARNIAFLAPKLEPGLYHGLMDLNFRRSGAVFYRPTCDGCQACKALRLEVNAFSPSRGQRRCLKRNHDLTVTVGRPTPTPQKHLLYKEYLEKRHDRQMDGSWEEFCQFLYSSPLKTQEVTFKEKDGSLVGAGIFDLEPQAVSTVYCFFNPEVTERSMGTFNILWMIDYCKKRKIPHLYLGYTVEGCHKMSYKLQFRPCQVLEASGDWKTLP